MHRAAVWQHSSWNIRFVHNAIEPFLWSPCDFSSNDVLSCIWTVFTNSFFSENSQAGWDLGKRMTRVYRFDTKLVCTMGNYAWGIQVFCSRNEAPPHLSNRKFEHLFHNFPWDRLMSRKQSTDKRGNHQKRNQTDSTRNAQ